MESLGMIVPLTVNSEICFLFYHARKISQQNILFSVVFTNLKIRLNKPLEVRLSRTLHTIQPKMIYTVLYIYTIDEVSKKNVGIQNNEFRAEWAALWRTPRT